MRLLELETRHWRGLSQRLSSLSPRLNLVLGPNEAGKSRLFQAIQFVLFESHKGAAQHKQRLQSWTCAESPAVRLVFDVEGQQYELQKQFLRGAVAQLSGGGATLRGEDAEAQLRHLLGTRTGGTRGPQAEELGIWPLLMVAQGASRRGTGEDLNEDGRARLQERLSQEIGVAAISERGQRLMERVHEEYGRYYTATGQETMLLRHARTALSEAERDLQEAQKAHEDREKTVHDLQHARADLGSLSQRLENAKRLAEAAEQRATAARRAGTERATAQGRLDTAVVTADSAERELQERQQADEALRRLDQAGETLQLTIKRLISHQQTLDASFEAAGQRVSAVEEALKAARAALEQSHREARRGELTERRRELWTKVANLERIDQEWQKAQQQRAREPEISEEILTRLSRLAEAARTAEARLHGAAVSVVVILKQATAVDGAPYPAGTRLSFDVVENRIVSLGEMATIEVQPGRGTLDKLRDAKSRSDADLAEALGSCGVPTVPEARAAYERVQRITRRIEQLAGEARATWSRPRDALREELLRVDAELERLGAMMSVMGSEESLQSAVIVAETQWNSARDARDALNAELTRIRCDVAAQNGVRRNQQIERERLASDLTTRPTPEALAHRVHEALRDRALAQRVFEKCTREFADLGGQDAERDVKRLSQAVQTLQGGAQEARGRVERLTGMLHALAGVGTYDTLQDAQAYLERARVQLERLQRQAAAAKRLRDVLSEERRRVVERLTVPVMQRVRPYLVSLFPGSELDLGEELGMVGLRGETVREPFEELSGGAQEQLALLTRIGLAEVLAGEGTLPLVLDDSLVNTDSERIRQIHRLLFRAADRLQVLVFSCHDVFFDGLGAQQVFRLNGVRRVHE